MWERRRQLPIDSIQLRDQLTDPQREVLRVLEYFGWQLHFVRRRVLRDPLPVVHAGDRKFAVIRTDGSIDEDPALSIRH